MRRIFLFSVVLALLPCLASGKRVAPPKVESVIHDGIRYVAPNLKTKAITQSDAPGSPAPAESADLHDVPEVIDRAITNGLLGKNYELSFRVTPFYRRGDFNGDAKADFAVPLKQRSTGKLGIAIIDGATNKITILGAGIAIGNGGDDFEWMDSWQVLSKGNAASRADVPKLHGDALLVSKSEAASALIYWNGKRYAWLQQGD